MFEISATSGKTILGCALGLALFGVLTGAKAATFEVLYTFKGGSEGNPHGGVIADKAGNLYGTTAGTVFKLAPDGTETVLHVFGGGNDGSDSTAGVVADKAGNLYGTTLAGGAYRNGIVFKLAPDGSETLRYDFKGGRDGAYPAAGLTLRDGTVYGTTPYGGGRGCFQQMGCGTVFKVARNGTETVLHAFYRRDGSNPYAGLVADSAGNLYGTTEAGGGCSRPGFCGTAFGLAPDGTETVLHTFRKSNGSNPYAGLIRDNVGNLTGTTHSGGTGCGGIGCGTVFKLAPDGSETMLYNFCSEQGCSGGGYPYAGVIADRAGNLYGTASAGGQAGRACSSGCGTVFKLAPDGTYTVLYTFAGGSDGGTPYAGLLLRKGYLYGTAFAGGGSGCELGNGCGTVFRVKL